MKKFLSLFLIFLLIYSPVFASGVSPHQVHVALVPIDQSDEVTPSVDQYIKRLQMDFKKAGFIVVSPREVARVLDRLSNQKSARHLGAMIARAQDDYYKFLFEKIRYELHQEMQRLSRGTCEFEDGAAIVPAYLLLGQAYLGSQNVQQAEKMFAEALRLSPHLKLSQEKYSPRIVRIFENAQKNLEANDSLNGQLWIKSFPAGAKVYVNGIYQGQSPVKVSHLAPGTHYITYEKMGFEGGCQVAQIGSENVTKVAHHLQRQRAKTMDVSSREDAGKGQSQIKLDILAATVAQFVKAEHVVLVGHQKLKNRIFLTTQVFDSQTAFLEKREVFEEGNPIDQQSQKVVVSIAKFNTKDNIKKVSQVATTHSVGAQEKVKKSSKKTILYVVGGLVLAGVAAGVALGMGGGGGGGNSSGGSGGGTSVSVSSPTPVGSQP